MEQEDAILGGPNADMPLGFAERQDANEIFRLIVEATPNAIVLTDAQGIILLINNGAEKLFGYSREELIGQPAEALLPKHARGKHSNPFNAAGAHDDERKSRKGRGLFALRKDGSEIPIECRISSLKMAREPLTLSVVTDISGRERIEDDLRASLREIGDLKSALDEHAIVAITDPQGTITFVNDKFCAISKYPREELIGQDHRIINSGHHTKEFIRELWTTIASGRVWHGEIKNRAKDGSFYWVDTTIVPFLNEHGKPRQYVAIRADITERKKAEAEFHELNAVLEQRVAERTAQLESANKDLESFSYSVSHDLRAPLRTVDGFSQAVLEDCADHLSEEGRRYLRTIREGAQKMGMLIDDLLTFSRLGRAPLHKQKVDTDDLVRAVLDDLSLYQKGRALDVRIGELPPCMGDPALLRQVWINLLSNAFKYTQKRELAVVEIGCEQTPLGGVFFVRDNGTGFDMRYAHKLFGVFQRLHRAEEYEGTGVGLALVQRIIHRHGGRVWADAALDRGATFCFTLGEESKS